MWAADPSHFRCRPVARVQQAGTEQDQARRLGDSRDGRDRPRSLVVKIYGCSVEKATMSIGGDDTDTVNDDGPLCTLSIKEKLVLAELVNPLMDQAIIWPVESVPMSRIKGAVK